MATQNQFLPFFLARFNSTFFYRPIRKRQKKLVSAPDS